jgi:hypothetical protein
MSALPAKASDSQPTMAAERTDSAAPATSERDFTRAIALMLEGLLTASEFTALTGFDAQTVALRLANTAALAEVQRAVMQMRNSGALARLEAARHARAAVEVAAQIMADTDMHPGHRISAATFIARAAGTERPEVDEGKSAGSFKVIIHLGDGTQPLIIGGERPATAEDENAKR